jgi:LytS/YehU family sensor histidine kinase
VPPLLLQPLVENSLKHGLSNGRARLDLALDARREDGWLSLTFSDDGSTGTNGAARGLGTGLQNLKQRVRRFAGDDACMTAGPGAAGGFSVTVRWREADAVRDR